MRGADVVNLCNTRKSLQFNEHNMKPPSPQELVLPRRVVAIKVKGSKQLSKNYLCFPIV